MALVLAFLGAVVATALGMSWTGRERWGARLVRASGGGGAYREGGGMRQERLRAPGVVTCCAVIAWVWGIGTLLVSVPAGVLLPVMCCARGTDLGLALALAIPLTALVLSGAVLAFQLLVAGTALPLHDPDCAERARRVARHARVHHAAVWVLGALALVLEDPRAGFIAAALLAIPCGLGLGVAALLDGAASAVESLDRIELKA